MKNYVQDGTTITLNAPYALSSGDGVLVGTIFGIASMDAAISTDVEVTVEGVFDIKKDTSTFSQADVAYWDNTAKKITSTASGNTKVGVVLQAQVTGDATARVRLNESF